MKLEGKVENMNIAKTFLIVILVLQMVQNTILTDKRTSRRN